MAKKKAARPATKAARSAKNAVRKAKAPARRPAKAVARKSAKPASRKSGKKTKKTPKAKAARRNAQPARKTAKTSRAKAPARAAKKPVKTRTAKAAPRKAAPTRKARSTRVAAPVRQATVRKSAATPTPTRAASAAPRPVPAALAGRSTKPAPRAAAPVAPTKRANLDRPRRTVADIHGLPSSLDMDRQASAARSGRAELEQKLHQHTNTSPALTAGDVDADWGGADSTGDEAPGGDNPTPDQDVVEEIGRALGVEYDDDEELQGGDEIAARDRHRWELDPGSSDDFEER